VPGFSPDERAMFESKATELFEEVVAQGGLPSDDPRIAPDGPWRLGFDLLVKLGLLIIDVDNTTYVAVDPTTVQSRVVSPMSQEGAVILAESSRWAQAFASLAQTWRRSPGATRGPVTEVRGDAIDPFIASMVADAETELLTAQPQTGRDAPTLAAAAVRDIAALERGVKMRTLYQHSARRSSITHKYVAAVTERGAEVRTLDEFFNRLIVVDRQLAVIPSYEGLDAALAIREPSLVAYLIDMFDRSWERARQFSNREMSMMRHVAAEQRAMTIRMLIEGHADPTSAKRLGVSPRTYAGYVAELKEQHDAQTRFQLGYAMGREGVSGQEPTQE
jgi:sugar-specific transcriptional regulator TrmB